MEVFAFCVITFEPIKVQTRSAPTNDCLNLSFVRDIKVVGRKSAGNGHKTDFCHTYANFGQQALDWTFGLRIVYNHHFIKCIVFFGNKIGHYANACQWRRNVLFLGKPSRVGGSKENLIGTNCF